MPDARFNDARSYIFDGGELHAFTFSDAEARKHLEEFYPGGFATWLAHNGYGPNVGEARRVRHS